MIDLSALVDELNRSAPDLDLDDRLRLARRRIEGRMAFTTSFGLEDQMLTHALVRSGVAAAASGAVDDPEQVEIVTLDTGRMFSETYDVWEKTEAKYALRIRSFHPKSDALEALVTRQGLNGFYGSLEARKACCGVRKVEPLGRALAGAAGWLTGLRAGQSGARAQTPFAEIDRARGLVKLNPLFDWDAETLAVQVRALEIPYNTLHDQGFPSIGCQPCTREVRIGEHDRAGRWWWELSDQECGLHVAGAPGAEPVRSASRDAKGDARP